jgi:hypothetical protein
MGYVIEKDIPIINKRGDYGDWPFSKMELGDSFVIPNVDRQKAYSASSHYKDRHPGVRFSIRKISPTQTRVWRVE